MWKINFAYPAAATLLFVVARVDLPGAMMISFDNRVFELITACDSDDADNGGDDGDGAALPQRFGLGTQRAPRNRKEPVQARKSCNFPTASLAETKVIVCSLQLIVTVFAVVYLRQSSFPLSSRRIKDRSFEQQHYRARGPHTCHRRNRALEYRVHREGRPNLSLQRAVPRP